jgi:hypothetical protein
MKLPAVTSRSLFVTSFALAVASAPLAFAQSPAAGGARSLNYVTGGVTKEEADALRAQANSFALELQFSRGGAFASDVPVRIIDAGGRVVMEIGAAQPILLLNVPPGRYTVEATFDGQTKRQTVDVGRGHTKASFVW